LGHFIEVVELGLGDIVLIKEGGIFLVIRGIVLVKQIGIVLTLSFLHFINELLSESHAQKLLLVLVVLNLLLDLLESLPSRTGRVMAFFGVHIGVFGGGIFHCSHNEVVHFAQGVFVGVVSSGHCHGERGNNHSNQ